VLGFDVVDDDGDVAVPVAVRMGFLAAEIDRPFDLEGRRRIAQVDQLEICELETVGRFEAERRA
jgi:hypothetical protein